MPLQWSQPREPTKDVSHYDHAVCETPLGMIMLEWKGWKDMDSPCAQMPWGDVVIGLDLDDAKRQVQEAWDAMAVKVAALASTQKAEQ